MITIKKALGNYKKVNGFLQGHRHHYESDMFRPSGGIDIYRCGHCFLHLHDVCIMLDRQEAAELLCSGAYSRTS